MSWERTKSDTTIDPKMIGCRNSTWNFLVNTNRPIKSYPPGSNPIADLQKIVDEYLDNFFKKFVTYYAHHKYSNRELFPFKPKVWTGHAEIGDKDPRPHAHLVISIDHRSFIKVDVAKSRAWFKSRGVPLFKSVPGGTYDDGVIGALNYLYDDKNKMLRKELYLKYGDPKQDYMLRQGLPKTNTATSIKRTSHSESSEQVSIDNISE